jgi:diguanylate cyclase (GGDEF)-like protein
MEGTYNLNLVLLSIAIAIFASYAALDLAARLATVKDKLFYFWFLGGAFAMGTGIWSMHFIGMLAFKLPIPMGYDVGITILSLIIAIVVSGCALWVMKEPVLNPSVTILGAVLVGLGICSMHYIGMEAMRMYPAIEYDPLLVFASIIIAIGSAWMALELAFRLSRTYRLMLLLTKFGSAIALGLGISGMHYTAMAAASYPPDSICRAAGAGIDNYSLAIIIAFAAFIILVMTLITSALDAHLASINASIAEELQAANEKLTHIAMYDHLTKLPSRQLLKDRVKVTSNRSDRNNKSFALLMIDLNKFKPVNDKYGHHVGDQILISVAKRLLSCIRKDDTASRIGGDEFVILLNELASEKDPERISDKIIETISQPYEVDNHEIELSCSIGISFYPKHGNDLDTLMKRADKAMYQAKGDEKVKYVIFEETVSV